MILAFRLEFAIRLSYLVRNSQKESQQLRTGKMSRHVSMRWMSSMKATR